MIAQALEAALANLAFGLVIGCCVALLVVVISERHEKRRRQAVADVRSRARDRGAP
jgi:hypothetical protein